MNNIQNLNNVLNWLSKISIVTNTNESLFKNNDMKIDKQDNIKSILKNQKENINIIKTNKDKIDWNESIVQEPIYWCIFDELISNLTKILFNIKNNIKVSKIKLKNIIKKLTRNVISIRHEIERIN